VRAVAFGSAAVTALVAVAACSAPSPGHSTPAALPDEATFGPVAGLLDVRCGSLDCHGKVGRNLRLYGSAGLRLSPSDRPLVPLCDTAAEVAQDYDSLIGLEPEITSAVVAGADPSELTLVRKARGAEAHKGGTIWSAGDDSDTCLTSWLAGKPQPADCERGVASVLPESGGIPDPLLACFSTQRDGGP
jgi:hypothetical protein